MTAKSLEGKADTRMQINGVLFLPRKVAHEIREFLEVWNAGLQYTISTDKKEVMRMFEEKQKVLK